MAAGTHSVPAAGCEAQFGGRLARQAAGKVGLDRPDGMTGLTQVVEHGLAQAREHPTGTAIFSTSRSSSSSSALTRHRPSSRPGRRA